MISQFPIEQTEDALIALLTTGLGGALPANLSIQPIGERDFDDDGQLILQLPAARVRFAGEEAEASSGDSQQLTYNTEQIFEIWCSDQDLRSPANQRRAAKVLVTQVKAFVIGARLLLADGTQTEPIKYIKTEPMPEDVLGMIYIATFSIGDIAQFPGTNSRRN